MIIAGLMNSSRVFSQSPTRVGTTAAEFLSIGYGSAGCALGDAYVSLANDLSAVYWNPAGLSFMNQNAVMINFQPWVADINTYMAATGIATQNMGTFAVGLVGDNYGEMEVTTVEMQQDFVGLILLNPVCKPFYGAAALRLVHFHRLLDSLFDTIFTREIAVIRCQYSGSHDRLAISRLVIPILKVFGFIRGIINHKS